MNPNEFATDNTRLADRHRQHADAHAAQAAKWANLLAAAKIEAAEAETAFLSDFQPANARDLAEAFTKVGGLSVIWAAITDNGGPAEVRARSLRAPAVFAALADGFGERAAQIEKLAPSTAKKLGGVRAALTERGLNSVEIEHHSAVCALRSFADVVTASLAAAVFNRKYCTARGAGHEAKSFDQLYSELTAPVPLMPTIAL